MTIQEMQERKRELGYSYAKIAELSGVPVGTVLRRSGWNRAESAGWYYPYAQI